MNPYVQLYLRFGLASAFLVSVSGRFGAKWSGFVNWVADLTPYLPDRFTSTAAVVATCAEILFAVGLLLGYRIRETAAGAGILLAVFGLSMMFGEGGWRAPFWYSVFTASAAALSLAWADATRFSIDSLLSNRNGRSTPPPEGGGNSPLGATAGSSIIEGDVGACRGRQHYPGAPVPASGP